MVSANNVTQDMLSCPMVDASIANGIELIATVAQSKLAYPEKKLLLSLSFDDSFLKNILKQIFLSIY